MLRFLGFAFVFVASVSCGRTSSQSKVTESYVALGSSDDNNPKWLGVKVQRYDAGPKKARLTLLPWPGYHWFNNSGGTNRAWTDIAGLSYNDALSPVAKYDLWKHRTPERSVARRVANAVRGGSVEWAGVCNGWAEAALYERAPESTATVTTGRGESIQFFADDIKALLSQFYFESQNYVGASRIGRRCNENSVETDGSGRVRYSNCRDINPGSLHMAMVQYLSNNLSFSMDIANDSVVLNHPAAGYEMQIGSPRAVTSSDRNLASGTKYLVEVKAALEYVGDKDPTHTPLLVSTFETYLKTMKLHYTLELDTSYNIIGGEWFRDSERPDFIWTVGRPVNDEDVTNSLLKLDDIHELLQQSTHQTHGAVVVDPNL